MKSLKRAAFAGLIIFASHYSGLVFPAGAAQSAKASLKPKTLPSPVPSSLPSPATSISPTPTSTEPPKIESLLKPGLLKRVVDDKDILTSATLNDVEPLAGGAPVSPGERRYSFYSVMLVRGSLIRVREVLTDYSLYSKLVPYVDKTVYSSETKTLDVEGGVWKWRLRSWVHFEEKGERWIRFTIVGGHFRGLEGDMFFENIGEKGTLVYFRGEQLGKEWPPKWVIERGAEIVFGFTAGRMRKYVESAEDQTTKETRHGQDVPRPRSHL